MKFHCSGVLEFYTGKNTPSTAEEDIGEGEELLLNVCMSKGGRRWGKTDPYSDDIETSVADQPFRGRWFNPLTFRQTQS